MWFLRKKCAEVDVINPDTINKLKQMLKFMYDKDGVGLAANQIKIFERLVVIDLQENNRKHPLFLINPQIIEKSEEMINSHEGCVSIKNITADVKRHKKIKVKYLNEQGKEKILDASDLLSTCLQHEIDLLDGIIFLDKVENKSEEIQNIINEIDGVGMGKLKMKTVANDIEFLKKKSEPVVEINDELIGTMREMLQYMYDNKGIGLAGVQVGILKRILVIDLKESDVSNPIFVINPEILWHSDNLVKSEEGCLSVPLERDTIKRYEKIKVKYTNEKKEQVILDADGLLSICFQHEIDHLNGVVFIDYLSKIKRDFLLKKVIKNCKNNQ
jgi:peptide deformylase